MQAPTGPAPCRLGEAGSPGVTLEGPLAGVLRRAAYLYRQPTDQVSLNHLSKWEPRSAVWTWKGCYHVTCTPAAFDY